MAKALFPDIEILLRILKGELPDGVYADDLANDPDPNKRSYSSSELRAMASLFADLYENLQGVNNNKFITTVQPDGLSSWEKELFASSQDSSKPFEVRKQNLLAKIRANGGISMPAIDAIVHGILDPVGLPFEIIAYSGAADDLNTGGWILDESPLDQGTFLGFLDPIRGAGRDVGIVPLDCNLDYAAAGITAQDLLDIQATAYTYEVRIFGNASTDTLSLLDRTLTEQEPARSTHVLTNNAPLPIVPTYLGPGPWSFGL